MPVEQPFNIYQEQLTSIYHGLALWRPDPVEDIYDQVSIGDVGYISEGVFIRMFNVTLPWDDESNRRHGREPERYDPLIYTSVDRKTFGEIDHYSRRVSREENAGNPQASSPDQADGVTYRCRGRGALLSLPHGGRREIAIQIKVFEKYIRDHVVSWLNWSRDMGLPVERTEDLVLVYGCTLTTSWAAAAFDDYAAVAQVSLRSTVLDNGKASFHWGNKQGTVECHDNQLDSYGPRTPKNHCVFIKCFRAKRILFWTRQLRAAAEPLPDDLDDSQGEEIEVTQVPDASKYRDPLVGVLDYIVEKCLEDGMDPDKDDMAITHHDDLRLIEGVETLNADAVGQFLSENGMPLLVADRAMVLRHGDPVMSQTHPTDISSSNFQSTSNNASKAYQRRTTKKVLGVNDRVAGIDDRVMAVDDKVAVVIGGGKEEMVAMQQMATGVDQLKRNPLQHDKSRPEVDIRDVIEPLTSLRVSLHDQSGPKEDIDDEAASGFFSHLPRILTSKSLYLALYTLAFRLGLMVNVTSNIPEMGPLAIYFVGLLTLALSFALPLIFRRNLKDKNGHLIPPGPPLRYPYLRRCPERALQAWSKTYGPLFSVWMGNQLFVVISDARIAKDLLVSNGAIFSSRKQYFMKSQTILRGRAITATAYNDTWRQHRRIAMQLLNPKAIQRYASVFDYEAQILIRSIYYETGMGKLPINPMRFVGRYALNNMLAVIFGARTESTLDPLTESMLALATEFLELTGPLSNIVDFIEPLQWIPTSTRSRGRRLHDAIVEVYGAMITRVKARMDAGEDVPDCLVKTLLLNQEREKLDWEDMCMLAVAFNLGGIHSTSGVILRFLALISSHLEVQARAHAELDSVVGRDGWPGAEDEQRFPYIRAIIKEVERAHAPFWVPSPHFSTEDFVYNGMYIPKNTALILDLYGIHHNEEKYPDPYNFNPERFLGDKLTCAESSKLPDAIDRDHWAFGAGRRICPGIHVAERELWLAISRLLWAYEIRSLPDEPISLEGYDGESSRKPQPYRITLRPRHDRVQALLEGRGSHTDRIMSNTGEARAGHEA